MIRWFLPILMGIFCAAASAHTQYPQPPLVASLADAQFGARFELRALPMAAPIDPDAWWAASSGTALPAAAAWPLDSGVRIVGRTVIPANPSGELTLLQVPLTRVDHIHVFYRKPGERWIRAEAGDLLPLGQWPIRAQYPAFVLHADDAPVELLVAMANDGRLSAPLRLMSDDVHRQSSFYQALVSGIVVGLGLMVALVTLVAAATHRRRGRLVLFAYAASALLAVMSLNGTLGLLLTPDWPWFNDAAPHFFTALSGGLFVTACWESLNNRSLPRALTRLWVLPMALALVYAFAQAFWLPHAGRAGQVMVWLTLCVLAAFGLCTLSWREGSRLVQWVAMATVIFTLGTGLVSSRFQLVGGVDVASLVGTMAIFASVLLLRHAQYVRFRFGRAVLGQNSVSTDRDPLTGLMSQDGLSTAYDARCLRAAALSQSGAAMLFNLQGLDASEADGGQEGVERFMIRFAVSLHRSLGDQWDIGRMGRSRYFAICLPAPDAGQINALATEVLSRSVRAAQSVRGAEGLNVRIAISQRVRFDQITMAALAVQMDQAVREAPAAKRIVTL